MSLNDGPERNKEMRVAFASTARDAFSGALLRQFASGVPPAYAEKPITAFRVEFNLRHDTVTDPSRTIGREHLSILPIRAMLNVEDPSYDTAEHLDIVEELRLGRRLGSLALEDVLAHPTELPENAVEAYYETFDRHDELQYHTNNHDDNASRQDMMAAALFAEDSLAYTQSDEFLKLAIIRKFDFLFADIGGGDDPQFRMTHRVNLNYLADLPLNGHEPATFIRSYHQAMLTRLDNSTHRIERLKACQAPGVILENEQVLNDIYRAAVERSAKLLR